MSSIPPNSIASILQSGATQRQQSKVTDADRNARDRAARELAGAREDILEVEATEEDSQVNADSEGAGASGRETRESPGEEAAEETTDPEQGDTDSDNDGIQHLDLTA